MIFQNRCCNPKTSFTAGSLELCINLPGNISILAIQPPAGLDLAGGGIGGRRRPDLAGGPLPWLLLTFVGRLEVVFRPVSTPASSCGGAQGAAPAGTRCADAPAFYAKHGDGASCRRPEEVDRRSGRWWLGREARFRGGCDYGGRRTEKVRTRSALRL
jgi:hypothetical protein